MQSRLGSRSGVRQRLAEVVETHSQAAIAKATGTSNSNIHYYLKGRRIPADFCARLAEKFNLNLQWLLLGEGAPYLTDLWHAQNKQAEELLAVIQAMNAINRMRLGAFAGKDRLQTLRKLNEALVMHHNLRERVATAAIPLFDDILLQLDAALARYDHAATQRLRDGAMQIAQLCDDEARRIKLERASAKLEQSAGRPEAAVALNRNIVSRLVALGDDALPELLDHMSYFVDNLRVVFKAKEACRVADVALALYESHDRTPGYGRLLITRAMLAIDMGDMPIAQETARRAFARFPDQVREAVAPILHILDAYAGSISHALFFDLIEEAAHLSPRHRVVYAHGPIQWACWLEDEAALADALKRFEEPAHEQGPASGPFTAKYGRLLLTTMRAPDPKRVKRWFEQDDVTGFLSSPGPVYAFMRAVLAAQSLRFAGDARNAIRQSEEAQSILRKADVDMLVSFIFRAMHARNVLMLADSGTARIASETVDAARMFVVAHFKRGYGFLRDIVPIAEGHGSNAST